MLAGKYRLKVGEYFGVGAPKPARIIKKPLFSIKIYASGLNLMRCGVVIGKGLDKRASARNLVKRAIFDAFASQISHLVPADYLFIPSSGMARLTRREIMETIKTGIGL